MEGIAKKEYIIIAAIVIVLIAVFAINKLSVTKLSVGIGKADGGTENCLISDYASFQEFAEKVGLKPSMEIDLKNKEYASYYNEEFFSEHKLGAVITHEDTSKVYIYSIDNVEYSDGKKTATVTYTDKTEGYNGTYKNSWNNVMLVELDKKVENIKFVKSSSTDEK